MNFFCNYFVAYYIFNENFDLFVYNMMEYHFISSYFIYLLKTHDIYSNSNPCNLSIIGFHSFNSVSFEVLN